ncbi:hypothetical protein OHA98_41380 [Streptomyces sp. NBC_00654]|uniref:hypothetical protein n=1 Tax=Streptomyces sp. NBC_00654 TaxID=2975799 RepID=UPI002252588D|nr:hypothetical protein [Streptomyces sp. NBC_00654]MCX4971066.1 hypothetical protein [Streptomyces sp. NBC_00654]
MQIGDRLLENVVGPCRDQAGLERRATTVHGQPIPTLRQALAQRRQCATLDGAAEAWTIDSSELLAGQISMYDDDHDLGVGTRRTFEPSMYWNRVP